MVVSVVASQKITEGTVFDTEFEQGCIVVTAPDELGHFEARDSEGVACEFSLRIRLIESKRPSQGRLRGMASPHRGDRPGEFLQR